MATLADGQTLGQLITASWPAFTSLSPLRQKLVYDGMAVINPNVSPAGSSLTSDAPGIRRADIGVDLNGPQMYSLVEQYDPGLVLIAKAVRDANKDKPQGDILVLPIGEDAKRACRYRVPVGAKILVPPASHLETLSNPKRLILRNEWLRDLSMLKGLTPVELDLSSNDASDLRPLAAMKSLRKLRLDHMPVTDLLPLRGLPLTSLRLVNIPATSIAPLAGMPLEHLDLKASKVKDLMPLKGMKLKHLNLDLCPAGNLVPLVGMPFEYLQLNLYTKYPDLNLLKDNTIAVARIGDVPKETWVYEYELLQSGHADTGATIQACGGEKKSTGAKAAAKRPPPPPPPKPKKKKGPTLDIDLDL
jgi:hypothetical protein